MNKEKIVQSIATLYGLKLTYFDSFGKHHKAKYEECLAFLNTIGLDVSNTEDLAKHLDDLSFNEWQYWLPPVQVITKWQLPVIRFRVSIKDFDKEFEWFLQTEDGQSHYGNISPKSLIIKSYKNFRKSGNFLELELPLTIRPGLGYHDLKIVDAEKKEASMKLIIVPEKCYWPEGLKKSQKINGPKIKLGSTINFKIGDYASIEEIIDLVSKEKVQTVSIGPVNKLSYSSEQLINPDLPSSRMLFNTIYLNIDKIIEFTEDKSEQISLLASELKNKLKKHLENDEIEYKTIYNLKLNLFKQIYQVFCENHININSEKAQKLNGYIGSKKIRLRKLCLFEALQEHFSKEYEGEFSSWHDWPEAYQDPESQAVKTFEKNNLELIQFYEFLQWQADIQLESAAKASFKKGLQVGLLSTLQFGINPNGADAWFYQSRYTFKAKGKPISPDYKKIENLFPETPPFLPNSLYENAYSYVIEMLRLNMYHSGALKINYIEGYDSLKWIVKDESGEYEFFVNYPFEDLIGILALESERNKCLIVVDDSLNPDPKVKKAVLEYGMVRFSQFNLKEITNYEDIKKFYSSEKGKALSEKALQEKEISKLKNIPDCTYRLQFNHLFNFQDAIKLIPYLKKLGISHFYASPLLQSRLNSMHGYDIINHNSFNPSLGSNEDFSKLINELKNSAMGMILDIVPNHMGISTDNKWWMDVLENGPSSKYAIYFDIDWNPLKPELKSKVLVPILGDHYGNILVNGELNLSFEKEKGKLYLHYYNHKFPINPSSYPMLLDYRINLLASRLGSTNEDYFEYQSIITEFKNLPKHTEKDPVKINERIREKDIASKRLSNLCNKNNLITDFVFENLHDFKVKPGDPLAQRKMHNILEEQAYRLAYWRVSSDEINYRRFFDINDLASICVNDPVVFTNTHNFILDLIEEGKISGLRIDHPDGLFDPTKYFIDLQAEICSRLGINFIPDDETLCGSRILPYYIVAEKILSKFERLPESWAVDGTVGYEFLNSVSKLLIDKKNESKLDKTYQKFINTVIDFPELALECRKIIMKTSLASELNVLSNIINQLSEKYYNSRDYTLNSLKETLIEIIAQFPVYRTYISEKETSKKDADYIKWAVGSAKKRTLSTDPSIFDFVEKILLTEFEEDKESENYKEILRFAMKFQQYTGPLMAKGLEDTCFYRYNRLLALNEVGGDPSVFGITVQDFHNQQIDRLEYTPYSMLCSSTHDTKRSEDSRARLCVLSEIPDEWQNAVTKWAHLNKSKKTKSEKGLIPDKNDEYLFYQTLISIWPYYEVNDEEKESIINRIEEYIIKAIKEAKTHTSWINTNTEYEESFKSFIRKTLTVPEKHPFWKEFLSFQKGVALRGFVNSVSQVLIKLTSPGVPDIYQGSEVWDFSLVDPDNRRQVDYDHNTELLDQIFTLIDSKEALNINTLLDTLQPIESGKLKLFITASILNFRKNHPDIFKNGSYIPLEITGSEQNNIVAFARKFEGHFIISVIPRLVYHKVTNNKHLINPDLWKDTKIILPKELLNAKYFNEFTKETIKPQNNELLVKDILNILPIAFISGSLKLT